MSTSGTSIGQTVSHTGFGLSSWLKRLPLTGYFVLAYALSWLTLMVAVVAIQLDWLPSDSPIMDVASQFGALAPAIAAVVVTAAIGGKPAVGQLLRRCVQWRVGIHWYLFALFAIPLIFLAGATFVYGPELWQILAQQWSVLLVGYLPAVAMATILTGLAEEPGWRGFALPRLQARYSPLVASLILGIVWHLWHLPSMLFQPGGLSMFFLWGLATIVNGFILAWAYNSTGGSILIAALLHATQNTSTRVLSVLLYAMNPELLADQVQYMREIYLIAAASFGVLLLLVIIRTRGTLAYKGGKAAEVVLERE